MTAPNPELALDIIDMQVAIASQGDVSGLAFRFFLRDGQSVVFALPDHQAKQFATAILDELKKLASPSQTKQRQ